MAINWPSSIPESPLLEGYSSTRNKTKLVSTVDAGLRKYRNRYRAVELLKSETFMFTNSEKQLFENFYENQLNGGADRFVRLNPETNIDSEYRFAPTEPTYEVSGWGNDGAMWRVSFELELMP